MLVNGESACTRLDIQTRNRIKLQKNDKEWFRIIICLYILKDQKAKNVTGFMNFF